MDVVYVSNDNYARHLGVSVCSLLDCNKGADAINVYLLSAGMTEGNIERLRTVTDQFGRRLHVIDLGDVRERIPYDIDPGGFDVSTLGRLFIGDLLPADLDRVLYLDCDTVVAASLKSLWNADLRGKILGAVMEPTIYPAVKEQLGLASGQPYYNAGALLVNLNRWRKEGAGRKLLDFYKEKSGRLFACDQDVINGALKSRIRTLPPRYNFFTNYRYFHYRDLAGRSPSYAFVPRRDFLVAKRRPAIIHFMGDERPWIAGNLNHYRRFYEFYLSRTPWRGSPQVKGERLYMLAYHLMNCLTAVCPPARRWISLKFGMKMVNSRKRIDKNGGVR